MEEDLVAGSSQWWLCRSQHHSAADAAHPVLWLVVRVVPLPHFTGHALSLQYLLALAEPPGPDGEVTSWVSFCKVHQRALHALQACIHRATQDARAAIGVQVGTGLNDHEREAVHQQIEPLCIDAQDHPAPACYK